MTALMTMFGFILPFVTISCPGVNIPLSGIQLAFGTTVEVEEFGGQRQAQKLPSDSKLLAALGCAAVVLAGALLQRRQLRVVLVAFAAAGGVLLLLFRSSFEGEAIKQGQGLLSVSWGTGYWIALAGFAAAIAWNLALGGGRIRISSTASNSERSLT